VASSIVSASALADFYAGIKAGPSFNVGKAFLETKQNNQVNAQSFKAGQGNALLGGVCLGYSNVAMSDFYIGLEGSVLKHSLNDTINTDISGNKLKLRNNTLYGGDVHLGYKMENGVIPFLSLGVTGGKFKASFASQNIASGYKTRTMFGFTPGLGLKYSLCDKWIVTSHYQYLMGKTISTYNGAANLGGSSCYLSQKIRQHHMTVGLAYKI